MKFSLSIILLAIHPTDGFRLSTSTFTRYHPHTFLQSSPSDSDFAKPIPVVSTTPAGATTKVNPNVYNIPLEQAAELWSATVKPEKDALRDAGIPFLSSSSKDYFVDDEKFLVQREGGLGMELLELAGGREDGYGVTIVTGVTEGGNAARAGIIPGDSISKVTVTSVERTGIVEEVIQREQECECRDFDATIEALSVFPGDIEDAPQLILGIKRLRRWPKIQMTVEYPKSQCAPGVSNIREIELFAGENLQRAMLNRGIVMDDPEGGKCDFCGNKCVVSVSRGMTLLNPKGLTEEKLMKKNPTCRLACKAVVGYNMQEGDVRLRVNLNQWKDN